MTAIWDAEGDNAGDTEGHRGAPRELFPMMVNVHGNVEIWCELSERWVEGFELTAIGPGHAEVYRRSDGRTLPDVPWERVRTCR
jgi:hypothetical protein